MKPNCSKNIEKHTPALFMMHHNKTVTISLKLTFWSLSDFFSYFCVPFSRINFINFSICLSVCLLCSASGERKIKLETAAYNVYQIGCQCYANSIEIRAFLIIVPFTKNAQLSNCPLPLLSIFQDSLLLKMLQILACFLRSWKLEQQGIIAKFGTW